MESFLWVTPRQKCLTVTEVRLVLLSVRALALRDEPSGDLPARLAEGAAGPQLEQFRQTPQTSRRYCTAPAVPAPAAACPGFAGTLTGLT